MITIVSIVKLISIVLQLQVIQSVFLKKGDKIKQAKILIEYLNRKA